MDRFIAISVVFFFLSGPAIGQEKKHKKCDPSIYMKSRSYVENELLDRRPFDAIVHINAKGWGTAAFISDSTLITAKHIAGKNHLRMIDIYKNVFRKGTVECDHIQLTSKDFKVENVPYDNCHFISSDISFIVLSSSGMEKVADLYTGHLEIADYRTLNLDTQEVILTGYPVDLANAGSNGTDILSNKTTTFNQLLFDGECQIVGYKLFTCSGDSGAPLWVEVNSRFYIIAIHHGGPEKLAIFNAEDRNTAALVRNEIMIHGQ